MSYYIKCTSSNTAECIKCGSRLNLCKEKSIGRCGHCGCVVNVTFAEKVVVKEDAPKKKEWVQMRLFNQ